MSAPADVLYLAWSAGIDRWFAQPCTVLLRPVVDAPFFFETWFADERHAHYGRFLTLETDRLLELTWVTAAGTGGAETIVRVELEPDDGATRLRLTHSGFVTQAQATRHAEAWPGILARLDEACRVVNPGLWQS